MQQQFCNSRRWRPGRRRRLVHIGRPPRCITSHSFMRKKSRADERACLYERLSYECYLTGQHERAIEARRAALEVWRASGARMREGDALQWLSRLSWFIGRRDDANRYAAEAVLTLESLPPSPELARAYTNYART